MPRFIVTCFLCSVDIPGKPGKGKGGVGLGENVGLGEEMGEEKIRKTVLGM